MSDVKIYQLLVRHFGNTNEERSWNGSIKENGCGKFADISIVALQEIKKMGFTHVWYTGVLEHASGTSYPDREADDPLILKGKAGSPYAVRDYFDVSPDLAVKVSERLEEFKELLARTREVGLKAVIDFVPNHVSRSYGSDIRPEIDFGRDDDKSQFFLKDNNFFYLEGDAPLMLPQGEFERESGQGRVTGNNSATWSPSVNDWYETVKLNYGHDYRQGVAAGTFDEIPNTWTKIDEVFRYWQEMGVSGFRCDMAHMVPIAFWQWVIKRARARDEELYIYGEAYDSDPMKLTDGNVLHELLEAGFDSVYDSRSYDIVKGIYESGKWANDIDEVLYDEVRLDQMLRYVENHDEVRVANPQHWGDWGANVGKPASVILFGLGKGASMLYSGQEVAEAAVGSEGFCGDNGRTSIFDYWCPPEIVKWVNRHQFNGGRLDTYQKELRHWYTDLFKLLSEPVFVEGETYGLNSHNKWNEQYGRIDGESCSGHWIYSFVRYIKEKAVIVVVNLHPTYTFESLLVELPEGLTRLIQAPKVVRIDSLSPCEYFHKQINF